ncbi:MAG: fumarylacetoacetate hydrolase family protein [candidate division Zixibacteria bacterium]|nr:fumarylacetoacetate hydrolase family protein [candidate division Zixibacteria bacterium]
MRLATVLGTNGPVAVVERADGRFIVLDGEGRPYGDVGALLRAPGDWRESANRARVAVPANCPTLRPVLEPGAVVCVGLNYRKHVLEMGRQLPTVPTYFAKLPRALTNPNTSIIMPSDSPAVDYEGELAVVIGKGGRNIASSNAWDAVAGVTLLNDVSMRDWQKRSIQFFAGKTWEECTPFGPAVVTLDELPDLGSREIVTRVSGAERQRSPIADLIFDVPTLIADLSRIISLRPGDLIATGTPGGVGEGMKPPSYLQPGDSVEISLEGIGVLRNTFERAV